MDVYRVHGGARLRGEVRVSGAKNSALKLMAATLLSGCDQEPATPKSAKSVPVELKTETMESLAEV